MVAGEVQIGTNTITTTSGNSINFTARKHYTKPVKGDMAAIQFFGHGMDSGNLLEGGGY